MDIEKNQYKNFLIEIKDEIMQSRNRALQSVNTELINLYYHIGERLTEQMQSALWGDGVIETLSHDLRTEFPGMQGFSKQNLWNMVKFYAFYSTNKKLQPLAGEISWSNNIIILEKCENDFQREYYIKLSKKLQLSKRVLQNKIESHEFERVLSDNKTHNFDITAEAHQAEMITNTIKDSYIFDFLSLGDEYRERELEAELIKNLKNFILELGIGFAYIGNQYHIGLDGEDYYLDLLFYHTRLKCYIVIELKTGKFVPEYAGKLGFYLSLVDDTLRDTSDQPTIGILICKEKNHRTVEYALRGQTGPMAITEYHFDTLPAGYRESLPDEARIQAFLDQF